MSDIIKSKNDLKWKDTVFGEMLDIDIPADCSMVVLCVDLHQHTPLQVLLPHQIYKKDLLRILDEYPLSRGISILPVIVEDKIMIDARAIVA